MCHKINKMTQNMTEEERYEWMLFYVSDKKTYDQTYSLAEIKRVLGMANDGIATSDMTETFWTDNERKYVAGEMLRKKLPIVNIRDRMKAVEIMQQFLSVDKKR